jgi:hypothetical protein
MEREYSTAVVSDLGAAGEPHSAVSWGAIFAGAVAALGVSFILLTLAAGFGLKVASPWPGEGPSMDSFTPILGATLVAVQVIASALGGYLAGRLRTKWVNVHTHEVHFRDTAHGLLTWALATVAGVILAAGVMAPAVDEAATPAAVAASTAAQNDPGLANGVATAANPAAANPALNPAAPPRVDPATIAADAKRAADLAAQFSLFMGIGLLLGAFTASVAAAVGGLRRDEMHGVFWRDHARSAAPGV